MNTTLQIRIDEKTKKKAQKVFKKMGIDMSTGVKLYLQQVVTTESIPFRIVTENGYTPEYEQEILKELEEAKKSGKSYATVQELHDDIFNS